MKQLFLSLLFLTLVKISIAQPIGQRLREAFRVFENDSQMKHAISSLYVYDATSGTVVFEKNAGIGLAPASTQKVITSVTALELLGADYRYRTDFAMEGEISSGLLKGNLWVLASGDPTLGSWRYTGSKEKDILDAIVNCLRKKGVTRLAGNIFADESRGESQTVPGGWIWDDIGNYYGAGSAALNWRENQYDLLLKSGPSEGDACQIIRAEPELYEVKLVSELRAGKKGSGDNAYIYLPPYSSYGFVRGTIPPGESSFRISGSFPDPAFQMVGAMAERIEQEGFGSPGMVTGGHSRLMEKKAVPTGMTNFHTHYSPTLDSIIYWFNRRSINLYGEALVKTLAFERNGFGRTDSGLAILNRFWKERGLAPEELNMYDGSGLSPLNRVTTRSQVEVLKYARKRPWFAAFYEALPEYNSMKMKSGTINGVKAFCGYQKSRNGHEYVFSFIVNNYNGRASSVVNKMYAVLNLLK